MEVYPSLVFYASIAKKTRILTEYIDDQTREIADAAAEALSRVPPLHSRYNFTTNSRMFSCLMEGSMLYCAVVDEAFGKQQVFALLEHIKDEFRRYLQFKGLQEDDDNLEKHYINEGFLPVIRNLIAIYMGVVKDNDVICSPQSFDDETPLMSKAFLERKLLNDNVLTKIKSGKQDKKKSKEQMQELRDVQIDRDGSGDTIIISTPTSSSPSERSLQKNASIRFKGQSSSSQRIWWRRVKFILFIDLLLCITLAFLWFFVCRGFQCFNTK